MIYHWNFLITFGQQEIKSTYLSDIASRSFYSTASFCCCSWILRHPAFGRYAFRQMLEIGSL